MVGRSGLASGFRAIACLAAAGGCGDDSGPSGPTGTAELGTGTTEWEPIADRGEPGLDLFAGPQGGHHFVVHARIRGMAPGDPELPGQITNPSTRFAVFRSDGVQVDLMFPPYRLGYIEHPDGFHHLTSGRILQVHEEVVADLIGEVVRITLSVEDADGVTDQDERTVTVLEGPPVELPPDAGLP
jgi:hypothetical protein